MAVYECPDPLIRPTRGHMSEEEREQEAVLAFLKGYRERRRAELQKIQPKEGFLHPNWIITERNAARWSQIVTS